MSDRVIVQNNEVDVPENRGHLHAEFLGKVANIVAANLDRDTVLRSCLAELKQIIRYDSAAIALFCGGLEWELAVGVGFRDKAYNKQEGGKILRGSPVLRRMAQDFKPVISNEISHLPDWRWIGGAEDVGSFLAVPMISSDKMVGAVFVNKAEVSFFKEEDLALVQSLAQILAVAIEKTQLNETIEQRLAEYESLLVVSKAVSSSLELDVVLAKLVEQMGMAIDMTSAYISDIDLERGTTKVIAEYFSPNASEKEKESDLGIIYNLEKDFGENQANLKIGDVLIEHVDDPDLTANSRNHYIEYGVKSVIIFPIIVKGQIVGFADLWESRRHREFTTAEIVLSQAIAQHAAVAIENARLLAEKKEQLRLATTLQAVGALLTTRLTLPEVFDQIFDLLAQIVSYDSASVQLLDGSGNIYVAAGSELAKSDLYKIFPGEHRDEKLNRFFGTDKVKVIPDTEKESDWVYEPGLSFVRSWIGAALMVKGELIGVLSIDNSEPNAYHSRMSETVLTFANQAAIAIENARLYEETNRRADEMMALHQVAIATAVLLDVDSLIKQTTKLLAESLYPEHFGFLLVGDEPDRLYQHPSFHGAPQELLDIPISIDETICGVVCRTGKPVIIGDVTTHENYKRIYPAASSEIAVPLIVREKVIGVINVESSRLNAFSTNDLRFLTTLAGQVATFIERTELYEAQRKYTAHLAKEVSHRTIALRSERDRMQAILDNAGEGIFFTDENGIILYVNTTMTNVTGYLADELLYLPPEKWPGVDESPELLDSLTLAVREKRAWKSEMVGKRKDERLYDISLTVSPIFSSEGDLSGLVGVHSDISYLKEIERLKARFISNVSHELRTPLTVIETYTTLLKQGKSERRGHYLDVLSQETKRLTQLIQDILDLSRLDAEKTPVLMESLEIDLLLTQVVKIFRPHAETKNIVLEVDLEPGLPLIWGNLMQIEQVITNLINNALIYTPESGKVIIKAGMGLKDDSSMIWFSVGDTGYGVPSEDIPMIFDRFFRAKVIEAAGIRGTGLGLAICKEIVERHQGFIEVESELNRGSLFTVWLPVDATKSAS